MNIRCLQWLPLALAPICSGCITVAAIIQSPDLASLNPEPPRHFKASLGVVLGGKPYHVDYSWVCEQKKIFTASTMQWVLQWKSEFKIVAKSFADGTVVFFWQPIAFCLSETARFSPKIVVSSDERRPATVTLFDSRYDFPKRLAASEVVVEGTIRRMQTPSAIGTMTVHEEALAAAFTADLGNYVTRRLYIVPESVWMKSQALNLMLPKFSEITSAKNHNPKGNGYFSPVNGVSADAFASEDVRLFNPHVQGNQLVLGPETKKGPGQLFRAENSPRSEVQLCYQEKCIWLEGAINEICYPSTRELIYVDQFSLKTAFGP